MNATAGSLFAIVTLLLLPVVVFAAWLWQLGNRVLAEDRFPPSGVHMIRRIEAVHGAPARRRARFAQVMAAALLVATAVMLNLFWRLFSMLEG